MDKAGFQCRPGCAACCIAISIHSPLPGYPHGKAVGEICQHLTAEYWCRLWGSAEYPPVCRNFPAMQEHCGTNQTEALALLSALEQATQP